MSRGGTQVLITVFGTFEAVVGELYIGFFQGIYERS